MVLVARRARDRTEAVESAAQARGVALPVRETQPCGATETAHKVTSIVTVPRAVWPTADSSWHSKIMSTIKNVIINEPAMIPRMTNPRRCALPSRRRESAMCVRA